MKNKIVGFALLGLCGLFLLAPSATPKSKPAGLQVSSTGCHDDLTDADVCNVTITGLAAGKAYQLEVVTNCTGGDLVIPFTADSVGLYSNSNITPSGQDAESGCSVSFYLETTGGRQLAPAATVLLD